MFLRRGTLHGQTMLELALVMPLLVMFLVGIVTFGIGVFYQQQLNNAVRVAARYAAIHSASDPFCPTASWLPPAVIDPYPDYEACDGPTNGWPGMRDAARNASFGLDRSAVKVAACWSGFWRISTPGVKESADAYDERAPVSGLPATEWFDCHIGGIDPRTNASALPCPPPATTAADDEASDIPGNHVTVYACYSWTPPLAGFLMLPKTMTLRAVSTEVIHRQR
jgi:hypothetical protein